MEKELATLRQNNPTATIKVEIIPSFPPGSPAIKRPNSFNIKITMNGQNVELTKGPIITNP